MFRLSFVKLQVHSLFDKDAAFSRTLYLDSKLADGQIDQESHAEAQQKLDEKITFEKRMMGRIKGSLIPFFLFNLFAVFLFFVDGEVRQAAAMALIFGNGFVLVILIVNHIRIRKRVNLDPIRNLKIRGK